MQKRILILGGVVVIIAILFIGGYFTYQYFSEIWNFYPKEIVKSKVQNEPADWKTYSNENAGYTFKYPKEWSAVTNEYNPKNVLFGPGATGASGYGGVEYAGALPQVNRLKIL